MKAPNRRLQALDLTERGLRRVDAADLPGGDLLPQFNGCQIT